MCGWRGKRDGSRRVTPWNLPLSLDTVLPPEGKRRFLGRDLST